MGLDSLGKTLILAGLGMAAAGALLLLLSRMPGLDNLGRLPGDLRVDAGPCSCFVPLASMILISLVATLLLNLIARLINRP